MPAAGTSSAEKAIVYLMAGVQFVNVLDFMMVNPLGPQFAHALNVATSKLPMVAGSYTAAACVTGILGSFFLERFGDPVWDVRAGRLVRWLGGWADYAAGGSGV